MFIGRVAFLFLTSALLGFAQQIDSNSITVTVSRDLNLQADQVLVYASVTSDPDATLDDVLTALQGSGITSANFNGVNSFSIYLGSHVQTKLSWRFSLPPVPLSKIKDAAATIAAAQQTFSQKKSSLELSIGFGGTRVSDAMRESHPCSRSDLMADARVQAQKLADAGGLSLGPILNISGVTSSPAGGCSITVKFASPVSGQSDLNSLTVTASRSTSVQPDQMVFAINVTSTAISSLDEVLAALQGSGVSAANFSWVSGFPPAWSFTLPVPFSKMKETTTALGVLKQKLSKSNPAFDLAFSVQGTQVSPQLQASQTCPIADLLADARTEAQRLAAASFHGLGQILAISRNSHGSQPVSSGIATYQPAVLSRNDSATSYFPAVQSVSVFSSFAAVPSCSVAVKFRLIDNQ